MELSAGGCYLPVACRFVPHDQWLVTHLNPSWKISQVKQWLLAKYFPALFTVVPETQRPAQKKRAVSPITFARHVEDDSVLPDEYNDSYDSDSDEALLDLTDKYKYVASRSLAQPSPSDEIPKTTPSATLPQYTLLAFSTGQVLEDHYQLSWYTVYPHELFELHSHTSLIRLSRVSITEYVKPYFEARVWALKVITKDDESNFGLPRSIEKSGRGGDFAEHEKDKNLKRRRAKLQWQAQWVIIHRGLFQLCKDRNDRAPTHESELSSLVSLRGAEHLQDLHAGPSIQSSLAFVSSPSSHNSSPHLEQSPTGTDPHIICAKFRKLHRLGDPPARWWPRHGSRDRDAGGSEESRKNSASGPEPTSAEEENAVEEDKHDDSVMIVMKILDDNAYSGILRILHRYEPLHSTFIPISSGHLAHSPRRRSFSPISFASASPGGTPSISPERYPPPPLRSASPYFNPSQRTVRYPEWRKELVQKARRAGLGDVGKAMEIIMFGNKLVEDDHGGTDAGSDAEPSPKASKHKPTRGRSDVWGIELDSSSDESSDESASEREWEGWEADLLSRRARRNSTAESEVNWASSYGAAEFSTNTFSPSYSFPSSATAGPPRECPSGEKDWNASGHQRTHTLSSYSSADSLLKRTIKRASPRKRHPGRSDSPSHGLRTRPRSPLAEHSDFDEDSDQPVAWQSMLARSPPPRIVTHPAHPSRQSSFESNTSHTSRGTGASRLPMAMAMTSLAAFGSDKDKDREKEKERDRKGKGKEVIRGPSSATSSSVFAPRQTTRKRSSTVQTPSTRSPWNVSDSTAASTVGASAGGSKSSRQRPKTANVVAPLLQRTTSSRSGSGLGLGGGGGGGGGSGDKGAGKTTERSTEEKKEKEKTEGGSGRSGRLKLSLSFAQVAAMGTVTAATGRLPPSSATSTSSFESPRFARAEESE